MSVATAKKAVLTAVKARLDAAGLGTVTSWPNKVFSPSTATLWCSVTIWPGAPVTTTLGAVGEEEVTGFAQVNVNVPTDTGDAAQETVLAALEDWFTPGRSFTYYGQPVTVQRTERANGLTVEPYWIVPLTIYFQARYTRPALA